MTFVLLTASWIGVVAPSVFVIRYTASGKRWWRDPAGQVIVGFNLSVFALSLVIQLRHWHEISASTGRWAHAYLWLVLGLVVMFQLLALEARNYRSRRLRPGGSAQAAAEPGQDADGDACRRRS